ncbi:MAG TPA: peptidylprolyl isomerase [bacterium]
MKYIVLAGLLLLACGGTRTEKVETPVDITPKTPYMYIQVKDYGTLVVKMNPADAPKNVENIISLTKKGFYDGLIFHRVIKDFMIQGGCPLGNGSGDPGYSVDDEFTPNMNHLKGTMSMANAGANTNGSQFFICLAAQPHLNNKHTVIGQVVEGMDIVEKIGSIKTGAMDRPLTNVVMEKVWIEEK